MITFYTDARASDEDACIGGYLALSSDMKECPWFSFKVDEVIAHMAQKERRQPKKDDSRLGTTGYDCGCQAMGG